MTYSKEKLSAEEIVCIKLAIAKFAPSQKELSPVLVKLVEKLNRRDFFMMYFSRKRDRSKKQIPTSTPGQDVLHFVTEQPKS